MKKEFKNLEDFNNYLKLTCVVELEKEYLLKDAKKVLEIGKVESFERLFSTNNLIKQVVENNGKLQKFDEEKVLSDNYSNYSQEEKALYHFFKITFASEAEKASFIEKNKDNKAVKSISDDQIMEINATPVPVPNDAEYNILWGLEKIKARDVWDCSKGCDVTVAVIDTGLDYNHADINNNLYEYHPTVKGLNFTSDNSANFTDPLDGNAPVFHGTHVSGTIAAEQNNLFGITGVAPGAKILPIKGLYNLGYGFMSDLTSAIQWAASVFFDVKVINNSWGSASPNPSYPPMVAAINYANSLNKILVFAAGNNAIDANLIFPQNHPDVIVVGATDPSDHGAGFSNYGSKVDVCAPGVQIRSLSQAGSTQYLQGTSMAAPHVSGMIALIKSKYPDLSLAAVRKIIRIYVEPYNSPVYLGTGRISLEFLEEILCGCGCSPCKLNQIIKAREVENKRKRKFKIIQSLNCEANIAQGACQTINIPKFKPCFSLHWADSPQDNIETHDTEIAYLRICNNYSNIKFNNLMISEIIITPNQVLPNGENSVRIVPEELICFETLNPCSCSSREVALLTRNASPGSYNIKIKYCVQSVELLGQNQFEDNIVINLVNS
ncbi:hypothetical protein HNP38_002690 [Chryseobacterium defluvii]|uniref:Peptidase S8/S53 domain-containing protein n=1 Tax=Chryseobacterium defluvii TaxID=160396 RepID=A0A840KDZ1_9FLAO|nr:S8 family serine peptidase [Chryseobacterium defluvii]MBB4807386.1 hypothetical protein [Chryseobacterium defluvii]